MRATLWVEMTMNVYIINRTIRAMCIEVDAHGGTLQDWQTLTEEELLYEAAVCMFGSQMAFELAVAIADRLRADGFLRPQKLGFNRTLYESNIVAVLSEPLPISNNDGTTRWVRPRFKNRLASLLTTTIAEVYGNARSIRDLLGFAKTAKEAREALIQNVWGFGPKQASLFLRRVGYCSDLAVLDVHVLDYLRLTRGVTLTPSRLGRLPFYEKIEDTFREVAAEFGYSLGCVDLATWLTMRVAKREAYL
jgi:N-glycosylase/DNA lyase